MIIFKELCKLWWQQEIYTDWYLLLNCYLVCLRMENYELYDYETQHVGHEMLPFSCGILYWKEIILNLQLSIYCFGAQHWKFIVHAEPPEVWPGDLGKFLLSGNKFAHFEISLSRSVNSTGHFHGFGYVIFF